MESIQWIELSVQVKQDKAEAIASLLGQYGQGGAVIEQWQGKGDKEDNYAIRIYLPHDSTFKEKKSRIQQILNAKFGYHPPHLRKKLIRQKDWFEPIKQHFNVLEVGDNLVIKASWADMPVLSAKKVITLDPGYAFGTGLHPTTRLCLVHLERNLQPGMTVLDLGTGSGILAIAAAKLGASSVLAIDYDPNAVHAAKNNVAANSVESIIKVKKGTLSLKAQRDLAASFDLVFANIMSRVVADLAAGFNRVLKTGGKVIASGINAPGLDEVLIRFALARLEIEAVFPDGEWYAVIGKKV